MPLYEFECPACKTRVEKLGKITEKPLAPFCPECKVVTRQLISLSSSRTTEPFRVVSNGKVIQERQVVNNNRPWYDTPKDGLAEV